MSFYSSHSQSRRPRTSPASVDSSGGIAKMFSSLKKKAAALVSPSPSPSFPPTPLPSANPHARSGKRASREHRPHTSPSHRHAPSSLRKHGLANHPRPPAIRPVTPRRDSAASTTSSSSFSSTVPSLDSSSSSSPSTPTSLSPSPIPSSCKDVFNLEHKQQITHLQDQISALQRAISPLPPIHHHTQRVSIIPEESESTNSTLIQSDSDSTYSTESLLLVFSEQQLSQPAKRSSVLLALYPSSRPSTSERKKEYDPFAKDTVQIVHALPGFGTSVSLRPAKDNSRSCPVLDTSPPTPSSEEEDLLSPISDLLFSPANLPPATISSPRSTKRSSIITLGQTLIPPPTSALPPAPASDGKEYKERNVKHLTRKEMASESEAEAEDLTPAPPPKDRSNDWLGALEYYMDMQDPIERPNHPPPPPAKDSAKRLARTTSSYLDMSPVASTLLPAFVQSSSSSIRSVRSRTKSFTRAPIVHSPPLPQAEFSSEVYESPRPAPLPPPLAIMALAPPPQSPSPSPSYGSRRSTPASTPSPSPSKSSSRSSRSNAHSPSPPPISLSPSRRRNGHKQSGSEASQSTVMSAGTVRNYHLPSSHAYAKADGYTRGSNYVESTHPYNHPRSASSFASCYASSSPTINSPSTTTASLPVTSSTSTSGGSTIGKRASRLMGISMSPRKEKEQDCTSGWF